MTRRDALTTALRRAGRVLARSFGKVTYRLKSRADLVTAADLESQKVVLGLLRRSFPQDDYLGEEAESRDTGAEYAWLVDPIDGTTNYAHGYPVACVSIGALRRGRPHLAGVYDPFRKELFFAEAGKGATLNGRPVRVTATRRVSDSLLITGFAPDRAEKADFYLSRFKAFMRLCHDIRRSGSAALDMAWLAAGRADGYWEYNLHPWDVAAGWLLVKEAGGKVSDFGGRRWTDPKTIGLQTLASNGRIHSEMLRVLRSVR